LLYKAVLNTYATKFLEVGPSEEEWIKAEAISAFLKAFEELTLVVSAQRKPRAHKLLPLVLCIMHALKEDTTLQTTNLLQELASSMCSKFEKYWDLDEGNHTSEDISRRRNKEIAFNLALVIAIVLDPRKKALYLDFFFQKVCKNPDQIGMLVNSIMVWMRRYFTLYEQKHSRTSSTNMRTHASEVSIVGSPVLGKRKLEAEFARYKSQARVARSPKSEKDVYLEEESENDVKGFDVLAWWKCNSEKIPILCLEIFLRSPLVLCHLNPPSVVGEGFLETIEAH